MTFPNESETICLLGLDISHLLWRHLTFGPVDEIDMACGTREGCIEPSEIVFGKHIVGHIALIYIDFVPLSALGFVACHGVGVFDLQGIVVFVFAHGSVKVFLGAQLGLVFTHSLEEELLLCGGECWSLTHQRVEQYGRFYLLLCVCVRILSMIKEL